MGDFITHRHETNSWAIFFGPMSFYSWAVPNLCKKESMAQICLWYWQHGLEHVGKWDMKQTWTMNIDRMVVSINGGTPKSSTLIGCSILNHPFGGTPIYGNHQITNDWWLLLDACSFAAPLRWKWRLWWGKGWKLKSSTVISSHYYETCPKYSKLLQVFPSSNFENYALIISLQGHVHIDVWTTSSTNFLVQNLASYALILCMLHISIQHMYIFIMVAGIAMVVAIIINCTHIYINKTDK